MTSLFARFLFTLALLAVVLPIFSPAGPVPPDKPTTYPDWWFERDVIPRLDPHNETPSWPDDYPAADDYAAANQGQVKHIAKQAYDEMKEHGVIDPFAAAASTNPDDPTRRLFLVWETPAAGTDDYQTINLGQLKNISKLFYIRLVELGYVSSLLPAGQEYPWSNSVQPADDYALANIGQVKHLFSFDVIPLRLTVDSDLDGLPNGWETANGLNPANSADALLDGDGDGWNNLLEYLLGRLPAVDERSANPRLTAGGDQSLWLNSAGVAHVWGRNTDGRLGVGDAINRTQMVPVSGLNSPVVAAAWGDSHGLVVTQDCQVHAWGSNYFGQLGDGTHSSRRAPVLVAGLEKIVQVAGGDHHSLALRGDGTVWAWGGNQRGQLGDGSTTSRSVPVLVSGLSRIAEIAAGANYSMALDTDGRVWVWGSNDFGQLGDATVSERLTPQVLTGMAPFKKIASGRHHVLALERTGGVRAWGANQAGQLGLGSYGGRTSPQLVSGLSNIRSIAAGAGFSLALDAGGLVWSWGSNDLGQLGDDSAAFNDPLPAVLGLELISEIAAGKDHAVVLRDDGTLLSWGFNQHGQLGAPSVELFIRAPQPVTPPAN